MLGDTDIGYPYKIYFKIDSKSKSKWFVNYVKVSVCRSKESQYDDWDNSLIFTGIFNFLTKSFKVVGNKWMVNKKGTNFIYTDECQRKIDKKREKSAKRKCTLDHKCAEHHGQCDDNTCSSAHYSI